MTFVIKVVQKMVLVERERESPVKKKKMNFDKNRKENRMNEKKKQNRRRW